MAKKGELEAAHARHLAHCDAAHRQFAAQQYESALRAAVDSLPTTWEFVAFEKRYRDNEQPALPGVSLILRLAPPLFAWQALETASDWYETAKRADKQRFAHLREDLATARAAIELAGRLWDDGDHVEKRILNPKETRIAKDILAIWSNMGVTCRQPPTNSGYRHVTSPTGLVRALCPVCGNAVEATLEEALDSMGCTRCEQFSEFVIVRRLTG